MFYQKQVTNFKDIETNHDMKKLIFLTLALITLSFVSNTPTADEIIKKAEDRLTGETSYSEVTVSTIRPKYTRDMTIKTWTKGKDYSVTLILSPAKDEGTVFLKRKNEIWNYIPSIDRLIKMPPSMLSQSWMGTDIKNDDLLENSSIVADYNKKIMNSEIIEGYDCYKIVLKPKENVNSIWGQIIMWISKEDYMQMKVKYFDEDLDLINTFYGKSVKTLGGIKLPSENIIVPANKKGSKTKITTTKRQLNIEVNDNIFTTQYIKRLK